MSFLRTALLALALVGIGARADAHRSAGAFTLRGGAGYPAPSFIGASLAWQSHSALEWIAGAGYFWSDVFNIHTVSAGLRVHLLPTQITPVVGGGVSAFFFHGQGDIQGLEATSVLGSLLVGVDWAAASQWRLGGGLQFHFPVRLMFPYLEFGFTFQ